jgi:tRNA pseudouridine38-40 synthase
MALYMQIAKGKNTFNDRFLYTQQIIFNRITSVFCIVNTYICRNRTVKTRYFLFISYKGTSYHGWQIQPNSITVQQILEDSLSVILKEKISTIGAGRTDTGVHARFFCAHFDSIDDNLDIAEKFINRLNSILPSDISISSVRKVNPDSNARYSAISRTYMYFITTVKDPFDKGASWYLKKKPDIEKMNNACSLLFNYSDFTSFSKLHSDTKTNICKIYDANWEERDNKFILTIKADRFLRNMVRAIVGTTVDVGLGKITLEEFVTIIESRNRCNAGISAPAEGLFLTGIEYPDSIFI